MSTRYYAVIDTNVLVSAALKWRSIPGTVVDLAFSGVITPLVSRQILAEYREVLSRPKFHLDDGTVSDIIAAIESPAIHMDDFHHIDIAMPDESDRVFYEVTMEKRRDGDAYLVTGNIRHFPKEPFVVTPRQMLDIILGDMNDE